MHLSWNRVDCFNPSSLSGSPLQYWHRVTRMPVGRHSAIQLHVHCNLRAFRLTKSITQSCGACACHNVTPCVSFCFCQMLQIHSCWSVREAARCLAVYFCRLQPRLFRCPLFEFWCSPQRSDMGDCSNLCKQCFEVCWELKWFSLFYQTVSWSNSLFGETLMTNKGAADRHSQRHRHRARLKVRRSKGEKTQLGMYKGKPHQSISSFFQIPQSESETQQNLILKHLHLNPTHA